MAFYNLLLKLFALLALADTVTGGPGMWIEIINETPYEWKLVYSHSYQMDWRPVDIIPSGGFNELYLEFIKHFYDGGDGGAEATYAIMGPIEQHFTIQVRMKPYRTIYVEFHDKLESLGNPKNTRMELGWIHDSAVMFVLAGDNASDYVSSNPPTAWMQATLPTIGSKSLRDIALPESHDAGISELTHSWVGVDHNTRTQSLHIYNQLLLGARWFDIRPAHLKGLWYTGHFSYTGIGWTFVGGTGRTIENIVRDINRFTSEHPGELIVLDITHDYDVDNWIVPLNDELWQKLFRELSKINDLKVLRDNLPEDLSTVPINTFITPGSRSAVIVVIPDHVDLPHDPPKNSKRSAAYASSGSLYADLPRETPPEDVPASEANIDYSNPEEVPPLDETNGFGDYAGWENFEWTTWWKLFGNSTLPNYHNSTFPTSINTPDKSPILTESNTPANSTSRILPRRVQSTLDTPITPVGPWAKAFIHGRRVPSTGSYSDTRWDTKMEADQRAKLGEMRTSPTSLLHHSVWIITQWFTDVIDIGNKRHSIIYMSRIAKHNLLRDIWKSPTRKGVTFPNLIQMDNIVDKSLSALCMVLNKKWSIGTNAVAVKRDGLRTFAQRRIVGKSRLLLRTRHWSI